MKCLNTLSAIELCFYEWVPVLLYLVQVHKDAQAKAHRLFISIIIVHFQHLTKQSLWNPKWALSLFMTATATFDNINTLLVSSIDIDNVEADEITQPLNWTECISI